MALTGNQKAYKYAVSNVARSGATRSGYVSGSVFIAIGGLPLTGDVQLGTLEIVDELNETPNTCRFRVIGPTTITTGMPVVITLGSQNGVRLFAGHVLTTTQSYWSKPVNVRTDVMAVDYTWLFGFPKVTKRYANQSASAIVADLVATYAAANGFTGTHIALGLPTIPEITFTNEDLGDALSRTANRIGAYWYVDYLKDVHFFFTDAGQGPADLVPTHPSLSDVRRDTERTQTLTRVYVEGRGSRLLSAVTVGDTMLPLETADMFYAWAADTFLKASFQGSDGGAQHLNLGGVVAGGGGTLVGPGMSPSAAPTLTAVAGAGVPSGPHEYAVTFVTAAGESLPSPTASITTGAVADPTVAPGALTQFPTHDYHGSSIPIGHQCFFAYSYGTGATTSQTTNITLQSPFTGPITSISNQDPLNPAMSAPITVPIPYSTDPRVKWIIVWAAIDLYPGKWNLYHQNIPNNPAGVIYYDSGEGNNITDNGYYAPTSNSTGANVVNVSNIATGAPSVTARKLYRTPISGGALKLLTTLANNTATTYIDTSADATLGATVPTGDTSGLGQPQGQILAGSPSLPVAGNGAFEATGGWAIIGNGEQIIRYTSNAGVLFGSIALTGIPSTGVGAITATIAYNSTVTAAPMIIGIPASGARSISQALSAGDEIYLVVQVDDATRQGQLAASVGGTGIREEWVQDRRLSIGEARARGNATLAERTLDLVRASYTSRDLLTRSGKDVVANLPAPTNLVGTFKIQHVVINNFRPFPTQYPTFTVQASSARFSFEDLLRLATRDVAR